MSAWFPMLRMLIPHECHRVVHSWFSFQLHTVHSLLLILLLTANRSILALGSFHAWTLQFGDAFKSYFLGFSTISFKSELNHFECNLGNISALYINMPFQIWILPKSGRKNQHPDFGNLFFADILVCWWVVASVRVQISALWLGQ